MPAILVAPASMREFAGGGGALIRCWPGGSGSAPVATPHRSEDGWRGFGGQARGWAFG